MRIEWVDARLWNWARWLARSGSAGLGYASPNWRSVPSGGYAEARIPLSCGEAEVTHQAVLTLSDVLQRTVREWYLRPGPAVAVAGELGVSRPTLYVRLDAADRVLAAWLGERERAAGCERRRVEVLAGGFCNIDRS